MAIDADFAEFFNLSLMKHFLLQNRVTNFIHVSFKIYLNISTIKGYFPLMLL